MPPPVLLSRLSDKTLIRPLSFDSSRHSSVVRLKGTSFHASFDEDEEDPLAALANLRSTASMPSTIADARLMAEPEVPGESTKNSPLVYTICSSFSDNTSLQNCALTHQQRQFACERRRGSCARVGARPGAGGDDTRKSAQARALVLLCCRTCCHLGELASSIVFRRNDAQIQTAPQQW